MYCESCGSFINDGESFCSNCGARTPQAARPVVQPITQPSQVPVYTSQPSPAPMPIDQPVYPQQTQTVYPQQSQPVYPQQSPPVYPQNAQPVYTPPQYQQVHPIYQQPAYQQVVVTQLSDTRKRVNGAATAGLVFGIITACICWIPLVNLLPAIFGLIFSIVGLSKKNAGGKGRAIAGIIMSGVGMLISAYVILALMAEGYY